MAASSSASRTVVTSAAYAGSAVLRVWTVRQGVGMQDDLALEFCEAHGISEGMFYKMKKQNRGLTPREMKIGTRTLITFEAAAKWRAEREAASTAPPEKARAKREQAA